MKATSIKVRLSVKVAIHRSYAKSKHPVYLSDLTYDVGVTFRMRLLETGNSSVAETKRHSFQDAFKNHCTEYCRRGPHTDVQIFEWIWESAPVELPWPHTARGWGQTRKESSGSKKHKSESSQRRNHYLGQCRGRISGCRTLVRYLSSCAQVPDSWVADKSSRDGLKVCLHRRVCSLFDAYTDARVWESNVGFVERIRLQFCTCFDMVRGLRQRSLFLCARCRNVHGNFSLRAWEV